MDLLRFDILETPGYAEIPPGFPERGEYPTF